VGTRDARRPFRVFDGGFDAIQQPSLGRCSKCLQSTGAQPEAVLAMFDARTRLFLILFGIFSTCLIVGDIIGGKLIQTQLFGQTFTLTVGMIPFPVTFLLTDVLNEFYGQRAARFVTLVAFGLAVLAYAFIFLAGAIPIADMTRAPDWTGVTEAAFQTVFLSSQRIIFASLCAYIVSQFVDIAVFHMLKGLTRSRLLWLRATGSTAVSQLIDTVVINLVAWGGMMSLDSILNMIVSSYTLKLVIALGLTPAIYLAHALVERGMGIQPFAIERKATTLPVEGS
jgi:queuosine precursor transporter